MTGRLISDALYSQIASTIREVRHMKRKGFAPHLPGMQGASSTFLTRAVILDEALTGGSFLAPSKGLATVCRWSTAADTYEQTELQIMVYNHSSSEDLEIDTPGAAIFIDGHYWLFADCEPLAARATPPWDEGA